jgi:ribonuclease E
MGEDRPASRSYFERAQQTSVAPAAEQAPIERTETTVSASVSAPVTEPVAASAPSPVSAPVSAPAAPAAPAAVVAPVAASVATRADLPAVASYTLQIDNLEQVAQGSGLVWVNSDVAKVAAVQAAIAAEIKPARVPRERPPAVTLNEGPLVLVETRKDLKDMNLPF